MTSDTSNALRDDPMRFGVGARITVAVMADDYVDVILGALRETDDDGLTVETGDVSTYVGGSEQDLLRYVTDLTAAVAASGRHAAITLHLSRGCPGEVVCDLPGGAGPRAVDVPVGRETGSFASAEWALYPLADDVRADVTPDHMRDIYAAIELAKDNGTFRGSAHFVTRLEGDVGLVLASAFAGWVLAGRTVQHVTSHVTLSVNSPSHVMGIHELLDLEHQGWSSLCDGTGADFYGSVMTEDGVMVLANGAVLDRPTVVASLNDAPAWDTYEITDERLVRLGDDDAILVYTGRASRGGDEPEFVALMSSVYTRRDGDWRLALYQQTPAQRSPAG